MGHYRNYSRSKMQSATFWPAVMQDAKRCPTGWLMVNVLNTIFFVVQSILGTKLGHSNKSTHEKPKPKHFRSSLLLKGIDVKKTAGIF